MWSHIFLFGSLPRRRPPEFTAILMFEFWREATATSVPGLLCQSGRRRPENVSILSSLIFPAPTANGFHRLRNTWSSLPSQWLVGGGEGQKWFATKKFNSPFWTKIWTSPPLNERFLDLPLQRCYSEFGPNQGLCWRVQVNQFFSN